MEQEKILSDLDKEMEGLGLKPDEEHEENQEEKPEEKLEEKLEEKPEEKIETKEEEKEEEEKQDDTNRLPRKDLGKKPFETRESKRRVEIDEVKEQISTLTGLVQKVLESQTTSAKKDAEAELQDELSTFATENNLDPTGLEKLTSIIETRLEKKLKPQEDKKQSEADFFNQEWEQFSDSLLTEHPNMTAKQLRDARVKMDELAHSKDYHDTKLKHIYLEQKDTFSDILFTTKKKSAESGRNGNIDTPELEVDVNKEITSVGEALKADQALRDLIGEEANVVHRDGEVVYV